MSLVLQDVSNKGHFMTPEFGHRDANSIGCIASTSYLTPLKLGSDPLDEDETIYGDDEISEASYDSSSLTHNVSQSTKRQRVEVPAIFFGTPCKAEHERRAKYGSRLRDRRLLRKDSLELARRKSVGNANTDKKVESSASLASLEYSLQEKRDDTNTQESCEESNSRMKTTSGAKLPDTDRITYSEEEWETDSMPNEEGGKEVNEDNYDQIGGDTTIKTSYQDGTLDSSDDSLSCAKDESPSTPTKQRVPPSLSRQSLSLSETDSSPGVALALQTSPSQRSPFHRSPLQRRDDNVLPSPINTAADNFSPCKVEDLSGRMERLSPFVTRKPARLDDKEKGSPRKLDRTISPGKTMYSSATSSPVKVVVRQTLSAWAKTKLETPQSPEKEEWERRHALLSSPSKGDPQSSSSLSNSDTTPSQADIAVVNDMLKAKAMLTSSTAVEKNVDAPRTVNDRPMSRIARPAPLSRIPKPIIRHTVTKPAIIARRVESAAPITPSFARIRSTLGPSAPRSESSKPIARFPMSAPSRSPFKHSIGPFVSRAPNNRQMMPPPPHTPLASSTQSSPSKLSTSQMLSRPLVQSSSPAKRMPTSVIKTRVEPLVRDARLIASKSKPDCVDAITPFVSMTSPSMQAQITAAPDHPATAAVRTVGKPFPGQVRLNANSEQSNLQDRDLHRIHNAHKQQVELQQIDKRAGVEEKQAIPAIDSAHGKNHLQSPLVNSIDQPFSAGGKSKRTDDSDHATTHIEANRQVKVQGSHRQRKDAITSSKGIKQQTKASLPTSRSELSRLTSLHTRQNETFISRIDTVIVRKKGENRPASPSSKIRRSEGAIARGHLSQEASRKAREDRAKKRDVVEAETLSSLALAQSKANVHDGGHVLGAGETSIFVSPPRDPLVKGRSVRWQKTLFQQRLESSSLKGEKRVKPSTLKGCLIIRPYSLDQFGNIADKRPLWSPSLKPKKVIVYKIIYDDDEK